MPTNEWIEFIKQSIASHDRQIGDLTDALAALVRVTNEDATAIRTLARVADAHEHRIARIEGSEA